MNLGQVSTNIKYSWCLGLFIFWMQNYQSQSSELISIVRQRGNAWATFQKSKEPADKKVQTAEKYEHNFDQKCQIQLL